MKEITFGALTGIEAKPAGEVRDRPVLFVHGWWGGAWVWDRFLERFAEQGYHGYAINLRGHHGSKPVLNAGTISFNDHLDDLREVIEALGRPLLVTHSASGLLAMKLAEQLTLPASVHLVPVPPRGFFPLRTVRVLAPYLLKMLRHQPILLDKQQMFHADLNRLPSTEQESVYARMVPASGKQGIEMLGVTVDPRRVSGPRLIISGSDDQLISPHIHRALAVKYGAEYREYPERAHYIMREPGWQQVAGDIVHWFDQHASG